MPRGDKNQIMQYEFPLPPLETQRRIAAILSSLDDKIENNNRINRNLEAQAQALFKSWFVDFEPFGGTMPEDWREGTLGEIADITMGQSPRGESYNTQGEGVIFYQGCSDFGDRFPSVRMFTTEPARYAVSNSILMSVRAPVGTMNVALEECCIGRGLASLKEKNGYDSFLLYLLESLQNVFDSYNGDGTVFGSINKKSIGNIKIIIPSYEVVESFHKMVYPLDKKIKFNHQESARLAALRDTLLPKLMKGEIEL
jgi:type I restriction enzyme S subunit